MKLKFAISAYDILRLQSSNRLIKKAIRVGLSLLEKYFGSQILLDVPKNLQSVDPELFQAISAAFEMKRLGIIDEIRELPKLPDEPFLYRYSALPRHVNSGGADFVNQKKALWKVVGETAERYLWSNSYFFFANKLKRLSYGKIKDSSINIFTLAGFSQDQRNRFQALSFDEKTVFGWLPAHSLLSGQKKWCPAQLISARYFRENVKAPGKEEKKEPMLRWIITTGLATGRTKEEAIAKGILEVIERDAFMISYLNKLSPPIVDLENLAEQDSDLERIMKDYRRYGLEIHLLQLPTDFPVHVYLAIVIDPTGLGPALTVGASADFDLKACIVDALSEAQSVRMSLKRNFQEDTPPAGMNRMERLVFWSKKENFSKMNFFLKGQKITLNLEAEKSIYKVKDEKLFYKDYYQKKMELLKKELVKKKCEACYVELSTPEIRNLGLRSFKVVIPELQPMHLNEAIPYFSGRRLTEIPKKFGYKTLSPINREPHPFP